MLMTRPLVALSLGLAVFAGTAAPSLAGDVIYVGGMKDTITEAVPVPAPVPVPQYHADYYFRGDAGLGFGDTPSTNERGLIFGSDAISGSFGTDALPYNNDFDDFVTIGVGVGAYFGSAWRGDVTAEYRSQAKVKINGDYSYATDTGGAATADSIVQGNVRDETTLRGGIFLFNGYYDLNRYSKHWFQPYVGGGIGFAWNELKRNHISTESIQNCDEATLANCGALVQRASAGESDKTHTISFAAQVTTGFVYRLNESSALDFNYRFLYLGGMDQGFRVSAATYGGNTDVSIDDTYEHQLRAGIRFDVN